MKKFLLILLFAGVFSFVYSGSRTWPEPAPTPLPIIAHAHNDYQNPNPLWDALHFGFTSIEVDVRLAAGILFVAHDKEDIRPFKTLRSMYLEPLLDLVHKNQGCVFANGAGIVLLIDVKSGATDSWKVLFPLLNEYSSQMGDAVTFVISGNRDFEAMFESHPGAAWYDGRMDDLKSHSAHPVISMVSIKWTEEFNWKGEGHISENELKKLKKLVASAHSKDIKIRFWNTDLSNNLHQENLWKLLLQSDVDIIGTDKLQELNTYLK